MFYCAWTLARAHARTSDRGAIAGYLGTSDKFDRAMAVFVRSYADQNEMITRNFLRVSEDSRAPNLEKDPSRLRQA